MSRSEKEKLQCYNTKANDSFRTKLKLYLFNKAINQSWDSVNEDDFEYFEIDQPLIDFYTTVYFQQQLEVIISNGMTVNEVYHTMKTKKNELQNEIEKFRKNYISHFSKVFEEDKFYNLLDQEECAYCRLTEKEIRVLAKGKQLHKKVERGWKLEIDRLNSNLEYKPDNCVMACYWCNNAKTDEFTAEEFMEVGNAIRKIWDKRKKCAETAS